MLRNRLPLLGLLIVLLANPASATEYKIDGEFDGCDFDKKYPLVGGGILVCKAYEYFYEWSPSVDFISGGRAVIGSRVVQAVMINGRVIKTNISGDFNGCEFGKIYKFDNGLTFECSEYNYSYSYRPDVKIVLFDGGYEVFIDDEEHDGTLYR
jgi:hypothetical protein